MAQLFRAVAVDYDGTLTDASVPDRSVITALTRTRQAGTRVVLVTGRILDRLHAVFPDVFHYFDAIVAENGAVIWTPAGGRRTVAQPVPYELDLALAGRGLTPERGDVLLATLVAHDHIVLQEIARLGLEVQLIRNRQALMILPSGISKGTGLLEALGDLGISHHSTIGVGDAENDHSLLEACELGVAVANAVPGLQAHADVVLAEPAGAGVVSLLRGPLMRGAIRVWPKRWQVRLGRQPDGGPATLPGSQVNVLIVGGATSGKSCLAGLLAERLVGMGYTICILDPEGDHVGLGELRGVVVTGGTEAPPDGEQLARLLRHRFGSVVVDLSLRPEEQRRAFCRQTLEDLRQLRERTGLPHWVILDEAHLVPDAGTLLSGGETNGASGLCVVTYHPSRLDAATLDQIDFALALPGEGAAAITDCLVASGFPRSELGASAPGQPLSGVALLLDRRSVRRFTIDRRASLHVRHWHKYLHSELPQHRRFFFRDGHRLTGTSAASIAEFHHELERAHPEVLHHHALHHDFSRWIEGIIRDHELAARLRAIEAGLRRAGPVDLEQLRHDFLEAIDARYAATEEADPTASAT